MEILHNITMSPTVIDLRSDTVTRPTDNMKHSMVHSAVGDDVLGEDPTVRALEAHVANLLGKQAALFVPSGTMANIIATLVHCNKRGSELLCGDMSHLFKYEQGASSAVAGVMVTKLTNLPDGTFDLQEMEDHVRGSDIHEPITQLVVVENTHNMCGGKVLPRAWLDALVAKAQKHSLALHMDGARIMNAAVYSGDSPAHIARGFHSVSVCFSKGLGAPVGSALAGSYTFIEVARRMRKLLGGGMRQAGVLAAAALTALEEVVPLLTHDHRRAQIFGRGVNELALPVTVDVDNQHTNIVMLQLAPGLPFIASQLAERLSQVSGTEPHQAIVKCWKRDSRTVRLVFHYEISDAMTALALEKISYVLREMCAL